MAWRGLAALCAVGVLIGGCDGGDRGDRGSEQDTTVARPDFQRMLEYVRDKGAPGVIALVRNGSETWRGATGLANIQAKRELKPGHRFRVASVTNTFVATVVLQLVGEGRLRLDDTIERSLPGTLPRVGGSPSGSCSTTQAGSTTTPRTSASKRASSGPFVSYSRRARRLLSRPLGRSNSSPGRTGRTRTPAISFSA